MMYLLIKGIFLVLNIDDIWVVVFGDIVLVLINIGFFFVLMWVMIFLVSEIVEFGGKIDSMMFDCVIRLVNGILVSLYDFVLEMVVWDWF